MVNKSNLNTEICHFSVSILDTYVYWFIYSLNMELKQLRGLMIKSSKNYGDGMTAKHGQIII